MRFAVEILPMNCICEEDGRKGWELLSGLGFAELDGHFVAAVAQEAGTLSTSFAKSEAKLPSAARFFCGFAATSSFQRSPLPASF